MQGKDVWAWVSLLEISLGTADRCQILIIRPPIYLCLLGS
jgi:hypothetical protein